MKPMNLFALVGWSLCTAILPISAVTAAHAQSSQHQRAGAALNAAGEGRRVFLKLNCYGCHGLNAAGGMGPNIQGAESGDVDEAVMQGEDGGMPSFRNYVTAADISNLSAYLNTIGTPQEPTWVDWWNANP